MLSRDESELVMGSSVSNANLPAALDELRTKVWTTIAVTTSTT